MAEAGRLAQAMNPAGASPELQATIAALGHAWEMVRRGVDAGLLDADDLQELSEHLAAGRDYRCEVLNFESRGETQLLVELLDDGDLCERQALVRALEGILIRLRHVK